MRLRLSLLMFCLFCIGIFSNAQTAKKKATGIQAPHKPPPPPAVEKVIVTPPVINKEKPLPPPPPARQIHKKIPLPPAPETPPLPDEVV